MSTIKPRINITADRDIELAITRAARRDRVPVAAKAVELLRLALELEEDLALATIVDGRLARPARFIAHDKAWL